MRWDNYCVRHSRMLVLGRTGYAGYVGSGWVGFIWFEWNQIFPFTCKKYINNIFGGFIKLGTEKSTKSDKPFQKVLSKNASYSKSKNEKVLVIIAGLDFYAVHLSIFSYAKYII